MNRGGVKQVIRVNIHVKATVLKFLHTRKNEDEKGTDPSNDADDVGHVWHKHGDEKSEGDPDHG